MAKIQILGHHLVTSKKTISLIKVSGTELQWDLAFFGLISILLLLTTIRFHEILSTIETVISLGIVGFLFTTALSFTSLHIWFGSSRVRVGSGSFWSLAAIRKDIDALIASGLGEETKIEDDILIASEDELHGSEETSVTVPNVTS